MTALQEAAARLVASRQDQGLPDHVTDPAALGRLAALVFEQPVNKKAAEPPRSSAASSASPGVPSSPTPDRSNTHVRSSSG